MDKVSISNLQGENGLVNVVRYFQKDGNEYIIYSLNEVDESGFTRLYVAKLTGVDGTYSAETLNDSEWNDVKNLVKLIVKANKEGLPVPVQDLNTKRINNITLKDKKIFKLNAPLVDDLAKNKPSFEAENNSVDNSNGIPMPGTPTFDVPGTPTFDVPVQPTFDEQSQPTNAPGMQSFSEPAQPTFDALNTQPFSAPVQPTFDALNAQPFSAPVQPTFDVPSQPTFDAQPFSAPVQPASESNVNNFDFGMNPNAFATQQTASDDYKEQFEQEKAKSEMLQDQVSKLTEEIENYKKIIENVKNIIEK